MDGGLVNHRVRFGWGAASLVSLTLFLSLAAPLAASAQSGPWIQQGPKMVGSDALGQSAQGESVAVSGDGNTAIVGGPSDNNGTLGATWVFTRSNGTWSQQGPKLIGEGGPFSETISGGEGYSVALSGDGNTALIGGPGTSVFVRAGGVWSEQAHLGAISPLLDGADRVALSDSGDIAMLGTAGGAWVVTRSGNTWGQPVQLQPTGATGSYAGATVALSGDGDTALVGSPEEDNSQGATWVFTRTTTGWTQQAKLVGVGIEGLALQGYSLALSSNGDTALIAGAEGNGAAWVFTRDAGRWTQRATLSDSTGDLGELGYAVALSGDGDTAMIGNESDNVPVFNRTDGVWTEQAPISAPSDDNTSQEAIGPITGGPYIGLSADGTTAIWGNGADSGGVGAAWAFIRGPTVSIRAPADGRVYRFGQTVIARYSCADPSGPGIATCAGSTGRGAAIDSATPGRHAFTVTATSLDGASAPYTVSYTVLPNNSFSIKGVHARTDGTTAVHLRLPGPGTVDVMETAWNDNLAAVASLPGPAPHRFVIGRRDIAAVRGGVVIVHVTPNRFGKLLLAHHRYRIAFRLWVSYTPIRGRQRRIGKSGLHFAR
jgi:hypothetical protein